MAEDEFWARLEACATASYPEPPAWTGRDDPHRSHPSIPLPRVAVDPAAYELNLEGRLVVLTRAVKLRRQQSLRIRGGTLVGQCHSIFSIGTDRNPAPGPDGVAPPPALALFGTRLEHTLTSEDKREVGAAICECGQAILSAGFPSQLGFFYQC